MTQGKGAFITMYKPSESCSKEWEDWAKSVNLPKPDTLHFTSFYCKDSSPDKDWPEPLHASFTVKPNGIARLGKAVVVMFDAPQFVNARFNQLGKDYTHSFPALIPHMTLVYNKEDGLSDQFKNYVDRIGELHSASKPNITFAKEVVDKIKDPTKPDNTDKASVLTDNAVMFEDVCSYIFQEHDNQDLARVVTSYIKEHPALSESWQARNRDSYREELKRLVNFTIKGWTQ